MYLTILRISESLHDDILPQESQFLLSHHGTDRAEEISAKVTGCLTAACQALERGDSVEATAQICGYNSSHAFRRAFKKRKGILPSDYRDSFDREEE